MISILISKPLGFCWGNSLRLVSMNFWRGLRIGQVWYCDSQLSQVWRPILNWRTEIFDRDYISSLLLQVFFECIDLRSQIQRFCYRITFLLPRSIWKGIIWEHWICFWWCLGICRLFGLEFLRLDLFIKGNSFRLLFFSILIVLIALGCLL